MNASFSNLSSEETEHWLRETDEARLEELYAAADEARREHVGDEVHLRGLIEISNICARRCAYCGLRAENKDIQRYRMTKDEILTCARQAKDFGYGTTVLQSGEDYGVTREWMTDVIRAIKNETGLAVTLSLGERDAADLVAWREAGADRYLLRFETSNQELYDRIHPPAKGKTVSDRPAILRQLKALGYEAGSGVMIGIPGQTYASLAQDIALFRELDLDMVGVGPFIAHPDTPLGKKEMPRAPDGEQVPNTEEMTYKVVALTRLACPEANIPSTTALATLNLANGRELGLLRGANVLMPNMTPPEYRVFYEIYPAKACIRENARDCNNCITARIRSIGRIPGAGHGGRKHGMHLA
ncbi:MAG TPA: [FeFe] hydrogenase H-cluster radical SAM maturase HydE [Candidatus Hydrogenedentes bacterium]|nr:[FeFe] hydrogenase H-cluster radical SAM maturase HydE [Candidatus Hydrogenedentota bacterium]